ncbi:MAG TPA: HIT domain-containing protein [Nitrospira sp.]|nr:HIT domain-containing protein [Pseudomonadota bacterium]HNF96523.1 HIT domain-containing protein [Pseudomonadota bacterium]HNI67628.1 HIT domain-containing protein [Nitrospira sp.]
MPRIAKAEALLTAAQEWELLPSRYDRCAICAMADGYPDDLEFLAENAYAAAVLARFALRRGHLLVVLRRHLESLPAIEWEEYVAVQRLAWEASQALQQVLRPVRIFVAALGTTAKLPNSFAHHHVHVIPIEPGTEERPAQVLSWESGVYLYEHGEGAELAAELRACWPKDA